MKREAGDGPQGGGPQKRYRGGDGNEIRLLIPSKVAGSIIGKGGHNISKLRSEHNASISVPDCPGPERILTVAADLDTMLNVIAEILTNLEDNGGRGGGRQQQDPPPQRSEDEVDIRLLVHQSQAGCIIGKGGLKIKELRDKTGTRIKIYSNCCPQSSDRIVQINGQGKLCIDAIRECMELLKTSPIRGMSNPYDPHNYDDYYPQEYGGFGGGDDRRGGPGGGGRPPMRGPGGPPRGGPDDGFGGPPRGNFGGGGPGGPRGGNGGGYGGRGPMGNGMNQGPPGGNFGGPPGGNFGGPSSFSGGGGPPMAGGDSSSTQVTIPKDLAGAIIGKGGLRIRKIRLESGAGITIDEPLQGSNDRIITITGNPSQIQMAQYLLQQSVRENTNTY